MDYRTVTRDVLDPPQKWMGKSAAPREYLMVNPPASFWFRFFTPKPNHWNKIHIHILLIHIFSWFTPFPNHAENINNDWLTEGLLLRHTPGASTGRLFFFWRLGPQFFWPGRNADEWLKFKSKLTCVFPTNRRILLFDIFSGVSMPLFGWNFTATSTLSN